MQCFALHIVPSRPGAHLGVYRYHLTTCGESELIREIALKSKLSV